MRSSARAAAAVAVFATALSALAAAQQFPELTGRIVDAADILPEAVETRLARTLQAHEEATTDQIVVVTLPGLQGYPIEEFGYRLGRHWRIGTEEDNGALLIVAPQERRVRIEVGYGLEPVLTDAASRAILDNAILPAFRDGDFARGVEGGVAAILAVLKGREAPAPEATPPSEKILALLIWLTVLGFFLWIIWRSATGEGMTLGKGPTVFYPGSSGRRSGGRSGGFSGGGGSFGGGGASGSW